jgi:putative transposase
MESENIEQKIIQRSLKIRIYPDKNQKSYLNNCLGIYRLVYNQAINYINTHQTTNYINVRTKVLSIIEEKYPNNNWFSNLHFDSKTLAVKEACNAFISNFKKNNNSGFKVKFKSKISKTQNVKIDHRVPKFKDDKLYLFIKNTKTDFFVRKKERKKIKNIYENCEISDSEIIRDDTKAYYLIINYKDTVKKVEKKIKSLSIDPGVRTLYNCYSDNGTCMKLGNQINNLYEDKIKKVDEISSLISQTKGRKKKNLKLRRKKINKQIQNIVDNSHNHIASFVAQTSEEIITSKLDLKSMTKKSERNINKNVVRNLRYKRISKLEKKLESVCEKYETKLHIVDESYTSLTCSNCMQVKEKKELGGKRIYNCLHCGITMDRDYNASKNIMLKHLGLFKRRT